MSRVVDSFSASCHRFYSPEHIAAGGFRGVDRDGNARDFPLMTLSVGVAVVDTGSRASRADVMRALGNAKQRAKSRSGNAMVVNDGEVDRTMQLPVLGKVGQR